MAGILDIKCKLRRWVAGVLLCLFTVQSVTALAASCGGLTPDTGPAPSQEMVEHAHHGMDHGAGDKPDGCCCCADGGYCSAADCLAPVAFIAPVTNLKTDPPVVPPAQHPASAPRNLPPELFRPPISA